MMANDATWLLETMCWRGVNMGEYQGYGTTASGIRRGNSRRMLHLAPSTLVGVEYTHKHPRRRSFMNKIESVVVYFAVRSRLCYLVLYSSLLLQSSGLSSC